MKKLVILSSRFPFPLDKGDKLRLYHQIKHLSQHFEIHLLSIIEHPLLQGDAREVTHFCKNFKYYKISRPAQALGLALNIFSTLPYQVRYFYEKKIQEQIEKEIEEIKPDLIYCQLVRMAPYIKKLKYPIAIDYMDAFSMIMKRRYDAGASFYKRWFYKLESKRLKKYEISIQHNFVARTIISQQDKETLDGVTDLELISNGVDAEFFVASDTPRHNDILFAGNMGYAPNVSAANYLIQKLKVADTYKVLIAGARPIYAVEQLASENVTVTGWIDDIRDAYNQSKIFVAPLFEGAGQQNKILQAMAMGVPCITTSLVNNAIGAKDGEEILIADNEESFTKQINKLLTDYELRNLLATNARKVVEQRYSWESQNDKLVDLFNSVT